MRNLGSILVAVDLSDCSQDLIDKAVELTDSSTHLVLLHVASASIGARTSDAKSKSEWLEGSHERLVAYRQSMPVSLPKVTTELIEGPVANTIVDQARRHQAELIVMGTHGRRGASRLVGGSIAAEVISQAECPVLTVRTHHKPTCGADICDQCDTQVTPELWQVIAEREG